MNGRLGKLPTPLEVGDTAADVANQVFSAPARILGNALSAAGQTFKNLESDIAKPREYAEIPPPPDVLAEPAVSGVSHIVEGAIGAIKAAVDGVLQTADGVRKELQQLVRR